MLNKEMKKLLEMKPIRIFKEEKDYAINNDLISAEEIEEILPSEQRWNDLYMERGNKETEDFLGEETASFLKENISYFQTHANEFLYIESKWFEMLGVEGITFEVNDVFRTYDIIFGLKAQKKYSDSLRKILTDELNSDAKYSILFNGNDGLWDVNLPINSIDGFSEEMTMGDALGFIYQFLFQMASELEKSR